ncbi:MAG TPA: flagellar hook-basal body complex protein FliE [Firmicutes bacterium]|nr:flagellar hook-basal body complex protein FliE [Bacillota bacterium]
MINRPVAPISVLKSLNSINPAKTIDRPTEISGSVLQSLGALQPAQENNPLVAESFEKVLSRALEPVNNLQLQSAELDGQLAQGKLEYVHQAMVMAQKASLALDMTMQIRNKVVEAYQEIMRTQV